MSSLQPEELVYAAAIVILSNELYPRKLEIVREYIQNASDALDSFRRIAEHIDDSTSLQIKMSIQGKSLLIWDNGIGMDSEEIEKLRRVAYSEKKAGEEAGYKGIGRLAGIAVANKLVISSTSYGDSQLHKFEFWARDFREDIASKKRDGQQEPASVVINRHTTIATFDVDPREHYTMVELREIDDDHSELLDPAQLRELIGDIAPVGFAPDFAYGERLTAKLMEHVPDYSPKTVWLSTARGDRAQIYKPYRDTMTLAEPQFIEVFDPVDQQQLLAYCWYSTKGKAMLGKIRPAGRKFVVDGSTPTEKKRLAGLVFKLFGFSVGDRNLPLRILWKKDYTRSLWFTGEIHIVNKDVKPTTDRADFVDNDTRRRLYTASGERIAKALNKRAQVISDLRQAYDRAEKWHGKFKQLEKQIENGGIERAELKARKEELRKALEGDLKVRDLRDADIRTFVNETAQHGRALHKRLEEAASKKTNQNEINDLAREIKLTSQARKVYTIVMEVVEHYFRDDKDSYYELSGLIGQALKKKY
jgi:hypothetical protein